MSKRRSRYMAHVHVQDCSLRRAMLLILSAYLSRRFSHVPWLDRHLVYVAINSPLSNMTAPHPINYPYTAASFQT
jgi:hypothetical protein